MEKIKIGPTFTGQAGTNHILNFWGHRATPSTPTNPTPNPTGPLVMGACRCTAAEGR